MFGLPIVLLGGLGCTNVDVLSPNSALRCINGGCMVPQLCNGVYHWWMCAPPPNYALGWSKLYQRWMWGEPRSTAGAGVPAIVKGILSQITHWEHPQNSRQHPRAPLKHQNHPPDTLVHPSNTTGHPRPWSVLWWMYLWCLKGISWVSGQSI
jgi:hypothetical protein